MIIEGLRQRSNDAFAILYKESYPSIKNYVLQNSGSEDDAKDVFQDTMVVLYEKAGSGNLQLSASLKTFIFSISRNIWLKKLRQKSNINFSETETTIESAEDRIIAGEKESHILLRLVRAFKKMTSHCKTLIYSMFFRESGVDKVVDEKGYKNAHSANNQKYKCLEQARKEFKK